ncbi:MAG: hypothetical protein PF448_13055 [Bacteroidales bacterium]|jgi:hypothetical protein|nr:hypothetical protein [Bacteroidales bacterium]
MFAMQDTLIFNNDAKQLQKNIGWQTGESPGDFSKHRFDGSCGDHPYFLI